MASGKSDRLAAVFIARNEARCIARCLESLRPWVDDMLVLDTGSTDETPAIARAAGAEVHRFTWSGNFAAARNRALELADADWNLVLDADEWIQAGGETLRPWCAGAPRLGRISIHSSYDRAGASASGEGTPMERTWITRLLPRGARYEGRVHEQIVSPLARARVDLHVGHDGYLDAQLARKRDRNRALLLLDLEDRPDDAYILFQLGKEEEGGSSYASACAHYAMALDRTAPDANWRHGLFVRYLHCLGQAGRQDEALDLAAAEMTIWADSPDFFFVVGNLALDRALGDPDHAIGEWLPLAMSAWERCLEIGDRPDLDDSVHGRGSHLARHNLQVLRGQASLLAA
jgi:glycosyltransferase involved in cell wall biosynthesis